MPSGVLIRARCKAGFTPWRADTYFVLEPGGCFVGRAAGEEVLMGRKKAAPEWGTDALRYADFSGVVQKGQSILKGIDPKGVDVYLFLMDRFARTAVTDDLVFQYVYRLWYGLEAAKLRPEFLRRYFELMEAARKAIDIHSVAEELFGIANKKGRQKLQFSFVTKLVHTADPTRPLYDKNIGRYFRFQPSGMGTSEFATSIQRYLPFYEDLGRCYQRILDDGVLSGVVQSFSDTYSALVPETKILDFIFWSAGSQGLLVRFPAAAGGSQ